MNDQDALAVINPGGQAPAVAAVGSNPDDAATAMKLGRTTGVNPSAIYGDLDGFQTRLKQQTAGQIVGNNPTLGHFMQSNPLAPQATSDDLGQLDEFSQHMDGMKQESLWGAIARGYKEGYDEEGTAKEDQRFHDLFNNPLWHTFASDVTSPTSGLRLFGNVIPAATNAAVEGLSAAYAHITGNPDDADRLKRELNLGLIMAQAEAPGAAHVPEAKVVADAVDKASPYLATGKPPPVGVDPLIDAVKREEAPSALDRFKAAYKAGQSSATRERTPGLFRDFAAMHSGEDTVGISAEHAAALYGDAEPEAGDGLLGFTPGIADQFRTAMETGVDLQVPIADVMAHMTPEVFDALQDGFRLDPDGFTVAETKVPEVPGEPVEPGYQHPPLVRLDEEGQKFAPDMVFNGDIDHALSGVFDSGAERIHLSQVGITDEEGQLLAKDGLANPDGTMTREQYAKYSAERSERLKPKKAPQVDESRTYPPVEPGKIFHNFKNVRTEGMLKDTGQAGRYAVPEWLPRLQSVIDQLADDLGFKTTPTVWAGDGPPNIHGYASSDGHIVMNSNLDHEQAIATAVHEMGHQVQFQRFYDEPRDVQEAVVRAYQNQRAQRMGPRTTIEQTKPITAAGSTARLGQVSRGFREYSTNFEEWFAEQVSRFVTQAKQPIGTVEKFFAKIGEVWQKIYDRVKGYLPLTEQFEDFMRGIWKGEPLGLERVSGPGEHPLGPEPGEPPIKIPAKPDPKKIRIFQNPAAIGMTKDQYGRYMKLIETQQKAEYDAALKRAIEAERQRQEPEWQAKRAEVRSEVVNDYANSPVHVADVGIRGGHLPLLDSAKLSEEQRAALDGYHGRGGADPDALAKVVGAQDGAELVRNLQELKAARADVEPGDYLKGLIEKETDARMEARHGSFDESVLEAAKEQAVSGTQLDLLHAELEGIAGELGGKLPFTKEEVYYRAKMAVRDSVMKFVDSDKFLAAASRAANRIEDALLKGDAVTAFKARQERFLSLVYAKEAMGVEKLQKQFDRIAKKYAKDKVPGVTGEWRDAMQLLLSRIGRKTGRIEDNIVNSLDKNGYKDLFHFVVEKIGDGLMMDPPQFLMDNPKFRGTVPDLTVGQFRDLHGFVKQLDFYGREDKKVLRGGEKVDMAQTMQDMQETMEKFGEAKPLPVSSADAEKGLFAKLKHGYAAHLNLETMFDTFERWAKGGVFWQTFVRQYSDAAYFLDQLAREYSVKFADHMKTAGDLSLPVENGLWREEGKTITPFIKGMTREHLLKIVANVGNESNRARLFGGYNIDPAVGMQWVWRAMDKDPLGREGLIRWAQGLGKIFDELYDHADNMSRNETGTGIDKIPIDPLRTPEGDVHGGWYHPIDRDPLFDSTQLRRTAKSMFKEGFYRATTPQGHWKARAQDFVGGPVSLSLNSVPIVMRQMIHDIAMRPAATQLGKFFYNADFKAMMERYAGHAFASQMTPFLEDMVNASNHMSESSAAAAKVLNAIDSNAVNTLIGMNPNTLAKHGVGAFLKSMATMPRTFIAELGRLVSMDPATGKTGWQFAYDNSGEVSRRLISWQEHYAQQVGGNIDVYRSGLMPALKKVRSMAFWGGTLPLRLFDVMSAAANFNAIFKDQIAKGVPQGEARALADKIVRQTHGSTILTNKPAVARSQNAIVRFYGQLYSFYGENTQMLHQSVSAAKAALDDYKAGEMEDARDRIGKAAYLGLTSLLIPAISHWAFSPGEKEQQPWYKVAFGLAADTVGAGFMGVRDLVGALTHGHEGGGLLTEAFHAVSDPVHDVVSGKFKTRAGAGKFVKDLFVLNGVATGITNAQEGKMSQYLIDYYNGLEHPKDVPQIMKGLQYGTGKVPNSPFYKMMEGAVGR